MKHEKLAAWTILSLVLGSACAGSGEPLGGIGSGGTGKDGPPSITAGSGMNPGSSGGRVGSSGGSAQAGRPSAPILPPPSSDVVISEIMYHPVEERSEEDEHEFVELHNRGAKEASVASWKLHIGKSDRLTLPAGAKIPPGGYLVLAKRRERLLAVTKYALSADVVVGDYSGGLDNGDDTVSILAPNGEVMDSVAYRDEAPWPMAADALGAQEEWLPALAPYDQHQYMGRSLERYAPTLPSNDPRNWEASPVDGATPGKANSVSGEPPAIVNQIQALSESKQSPMIEASDTVRVTAELSEGAVSDVVLEYRLDPVEKVGTDTQTAPMKLVSGTTYEATLAPTAVNTVVRYRVLASRSGAQRERVGPRLTDPREFYAYFVGPPPPSGRTHHLFISPANWTTLWTNISAGRFTDCGLNPTWDLTVPAVFVHEGKVFDVQVRHQGSQSRRRRGGKMSSWSAPGPTQPSPPVVLSWRIKFPRYDQFEGWGGITLNKQEQSCPGALNALESRIFLEAGFPTQQFRFARFYINGGYYNYALEQRNVAEESLSNYDEPVGDLFKSDGTNSDDDPIGRGDFTPIGPNVECMLTSLDRYKITYELLTNEWKARTDAGHKELITLIDQMGSASKDFLNQHFDVEQVVGQYALRNWFGPVDDGTHNYLVYKRGSNGKWQVFQHDFDCDFGGRPDFCGKPSPELSFFHPETGGGPVWGSPSRLKIQIIKAFRTEFAAKAKAYGETLLTEQNVKKTLDEVMAGFDRDAWQQAPVKSCDFDANVSNGLKWLASRRAFAANGIK